MARVWRLARVLMAIGLILGLCPEVAAASATGAGSGSALFRRLDGEIPASYDRVAENAMFQLYVNKTTLAFKVVDKRNGYVWHSNLDELAPGDRLNRTWQAFAQSGFSIDYLDQKAVSRRASITNAEHTLDVKPIDQGIEALVTFSQPAISVGLVLRLEDTGVSVEVPFSSIAERGEFKLGLLHLYPFMGATRGDQVPGYMFIPDGCGTLIQFAATTKAQNMFYGRYYGADLGMLTSLPYDPTVRRPYSMSIPVIGMVHGPGQNAYIAVLEKGASYGEIRAHPSGIITNFNFIYNTFIYNESYFQPTSRAGDGVTVLQPRTNAFDVKVHYRFLAGKDADYVGMARSYQQYLLQSGRLHKRADVGDRIGIRLEFLGAERERVLFWYRTIPMTTIRQMSDMFAALDVGSPQVIYYGWQPLGASAMPPARLALDPKLGTLAELRAFSEQVAAKGGTFYLYLDPQAALKGEGGYSSRYDLAMSITGLYMEGYNRNKANYYFTLAALRDRLASLRRDVSAKLQAGLALDGIGDTLYSDFRGGRVVNREDAIGHYRELLAQTDGSLAFYTPNDYALGYAAAYYDMPLTDSGYTYTSGPVPFLQIALSGYVPYFGTALNFSPDVRGDLLRHADFGVYPSFFVSYEETARILNTRSSWIYLSAFHQLGDEIRESYAWLNRLLAPVKGASIVARQNLAEGVVATTYSNGKQIIVNYNDKPFRADGLVIPARDALLREAVP
ncbi:MAG: DUF5696 domain-containing protein [Anaerolineae bacterium]|nr:DUF5696 domain-containing protein [Anaerolineae bacterium]